MLQIVERKIKMKTVKLRKNEVDEVIRLLKKAKEVVIVIIML